MHFGFFWILLIALGGFAMVLGLKGFTRKGLPVAGNLRLSGRAGVIVGIVCLVIGLGLILFPFWSPPLMK